MSSTSRVSHLAISVLVASAGCFAQSITSAHSGTVHYFDGAVTIDGNAIQAKTGRFNELKEQQVLATTQGRAEVLLTPGVFLRIGENSSIRMLDNRLASTRVEILAGSASIESDDPQMSVKDSPVTLLYKDYDIRMVKYGLVEITTDPAVLKVYKGEAMVSTPDLHATVKEGRQLPFSAALLTEKFDDKIGDDLYLWSRDRSQSLSAASMSSARSLNSGMSGFNGYGYGAYAPGAFGLNGWNGGWYYNNFLGMYTFVPGGDMFLNAFGYGFFSPYTIYNYYTPTNYWYGGGGARGTASVGRPIVASVNPNGSIPVSTLRGGASAHTGGLPALGSPVRGGGVVAAGSGNRGFGTAMMASAPTNAPANTGAAASSSGGGRSFGGGASAGGGGVRGGGGGGFSGGGHASAGGGGGRR